MLLPTGHPLIRVTAGEREVEVVFTPDGRRWVFPLAATACSCRSPTPRPNCSPTTSASELLAAIHRRTGQRHVACGVDVDENHGQWGVCELP